MRFRHKNMIIEIHIVFFVLLILAALGGVAIAIFTIVIAAMCGVQLEIKKDVLNWLKKRKK